MEIFTFRMLVLNQQRVKCEIRNPQDDVDADFSDTFDFGSYKDEISVLAGKAREDNIHTDEIKQLGKLLFNTLFNGEALSSFLKFRAETRRQGHLLRFELEIDETSLPNIASLPWEFMYAPQLNGRGNFWLATDPNLAVVRRRARIDPSANFEWNQGKKLRVATIISSPDDLKPLPYKDIWKDLKNIEQNHATLEFMDLVNTGSRRGIDVALSNKPHVFHILAHGDLVVKGKGDKGYIYLVDVAGDSIALSGPEFAELFVRYSPPIVILHVCESGAQDESDAFSSVASQVVDQNIASVIAMQYPVSNVTARRFMQRFYTCLSQREPIEKAVQEGRREIALGPCGYASRDFVIPILYSCSAREEMKVDEHKRLEKHSKTVPSNVLDRLRSSTEFRNQLVNALLECNSMVDAGMRQYVVSQLPKDIRFSIGAFNSGAKVHVSQIVQICLGHQDGIQKLIEAIEFVEGETYIPFQNVKKLLSLD